jgi:hypothetical protein
LSYLRYDAERLNYQSIVHHGTADAPRCIRAAGNRDQDLAAIGQGTFFGVPFDLGRLETHGTPVPLLEGIADDEAPPVGRAYFSKTGALLIPEGHTQVAPLAWMDSAGNVRPIPGGSVQAVTPRLSPDGNRLALTLAGDVAVYDVRRGVLTKLTFNAAQNHNAIWMPDGGHIIYNSDIPAGDSEYGVWWIRADGSGQPEKMFGDKTPMQVYSVSPDGRRVAFIRTAQGSGLRDLDARVGFDRSRPSQAGECGSIST